MNWLIWTRNPVSWLLLSWAEAVKGDAIGRMLMVNHIKQCAHQWEYAERIRLRHVARFQPRRVNIVA